MRNIQLFKTKQEYENFVFNEIFKEKLIVQHLFYRNLIQFVIDARAPIFYHQSDKSEHANFSTYYNFELTRDTYTSPTLQSMYFLHDFTHMLFYYPYDMSSVTQEEFDDAVIMGEYAASNETEIFIHYRIPEIRKRIFQNKKIFFDILKERGIPRPTVQALFKLRRLIIETDILDSLFFHRPDDKPILATFKSYRGNKAWCKQRYNQSLKIKNPTEYFYKFLTPANYERVITSYNSYTSQEDYERTILMNMRLFFAVLGLKNPPISFEECFEKVMLLEGKAMFKNSG
ncbi:hypothetical protein MYX07_05795 [Patescibacteria group bacterium AH-259-L07]|nr:hypothetical protein [Patescibacteria group bacterium AH-259-L07]